VSTKPAAGHSALLFANDIFVLAIHATADWSVFTYVKFGEFEALEFVRCAGR
jgi:hypothetical protein